MIKTTIAQIDVVDDAEMEEILQNEDDLKAGLSDIERGQYRIVE